MDDAYVKLRLADILSGLMDRGSITEEQWEKALDALDACEVGPQDLLRFVEQLSGDRTVTVR